MITASIPTFMFPTTIVLVDDSITFLENFSLKFGQKYPLKTFSDPKVALEFLKKQQYACNIINDLATTVDIIESDYDIGMSIFDLENVIQFLYKSNRFAETSILLADYSMPKLNGLELCKKLRSFPIRKVMLTGEADSNLAVKAFNSGIINKFLLKNTKDVVVQVRRAIEEENYNYFEEISTQVIGWRQLQSMTSQYATVFFKVVDSYNIIEYYQVGNSAYLMLDKDANLYWLVFQSYEDIDEHILLGKGNHAPRDVLEKLQNHSHLLFLFSENERKLSADRWNDFIFPIDGENNGIFYSLIKGQAFSLDKSKIKSYYDFMKDNYSI